MEKVHETMTIALSAKLNGGSQVEQVISWLLNLVSMDIRNSVVYLPGAKSIWDDLAIQFKRSNIHLNCA